MIEVENEGSVRLLRLRRPPANALNGELVHSLLKAVEEASGDAEALVIAGSPGMFSAGLDVPALLELDRSALRRVWEDFYGLMRVLAESPIPVAAAITGHSPAGGAVIALFCDRRVMADGSFKIGLNEVRVGLALPSTIFAALRHAVGPRRAERLAVEGSLLDGPEALRQGLVDEVVPLEEVEGRAVALCQELLALPRQAMSQTREIARRPLVEALAGGEERDLDELLDKWFSGETQTALRGLVAALAAKNS